MPQKACFGLKTLSFGMGCWVVELQICQLSTCVDPSCLVQDSTPPPEAAAASVRRQLSRHQHSPTAPAPTTDFISKVRSPPLLIHHHPYTIKFDPHLPPSPKTCRRTSKRTDGGHRRLAGQV